MSDAENSEELTRLRNRVRDLEAFVKGVRDNWDCDESAHKYGTQCRCCDARNLLEGEHVEH
jgi:hypothetical protein